MFESKKLSSDVILYLFLIFFFVFNLYKFYDLPPRIDQSFHIYWLLKIINSDLNIITNLNEIVSKFSNKNSAIYELFRVLASPNNLFSYYFQSFFIITLSLVYYLFNFFFLNEWILFFNFFSILFATLNVLISFKILKFLINDFGFIDIKKSNELITIFILNFSSYYLFNFSPLGIHNFSSFFFLLTIYFFLKWRNNGRVSDYLFFGFLSSISAICHISNLIFLIPVIIFFTLASIESIKIKFKLISYYLAPIALIILPLIFLIFINSSQDYLPKEGPQNLIINLITYFKNWFYLIGPISFIVFINFFFKKNKKNKNVLFLYYLIFFHLFLFLIIPLNESYIRNYLYIAYLYLIIFSFFVITINNRNKKIILFFLIINFGLNISLILDDRFLSVINKDFHNSYFSNNKSIELFGRSIRNLENSKNQILILPYDQNSTNYIYTYKPANFDENLLLTDMYYDHSNNSPKKSLSIIEKLFQSNKRDFVLISIVKIDNLKEFVKNFKTIEHSINNLDKCKINKKKIFDKKLYFFNGYYNLSIYKYDCTLNE